MVSDIIFRLFCMETAKLCCYIATQQVHVFLQKKNDDDVVSQEKSPMDVTHQNVRNMAFAGKSFLWFRGIQVCVPES